MAVRETLAAAMSPEPQACPGEWARSGRSGSDVARSAGRMREQNQLDILRTEQIRRAAAERKGC